MIRSLFLSMQELNKGARTLRQTRPPTKVNSADLLPLRPRSNQSRGGSGIDRGAIDR